MKVDDLMAKAAQAVSSARTLLDLGDADGACNRAYYAMFDAARAALLNVGADIGKTHRGVLNAFSERLIKNGPIPKELGRLLKQAETLRYVADYEGDPVDIGNAKTMVEQPETFIASLRTSVPFPDVLAKGGNPDLEAQAALLPREEGQRDPRSGRQLPSCC